MFGPRSQWGCYWLEGGDLAEASAILFGMAFARELGQTRILIQTDCLEVATATKSGKIPPTELGTVLNDIKLIAVFIYLFC